MNVDSVLAAMNEYGVDYLLIGGMNYLLRHRPVLTYDIDLWIEDSRENRTRCHAALVALDAQWGAAELDWGPVSQKHSEWLDWQTVFCLTSPYGAIDIFRTVLGLGDWHDALRCAVQECTASGVPYLGISDADILACQSASEIAWIIYKELSGAPMSNKRAEEQKRERLWDPRERWRVLQETITWADAQRFPSRNSPEVCLKLQATKIAERRK